MEMELGLREGADEAGNIRGHEVILEQSHDQNDRVIARSGDLR